MKKLILKIVILIFINQTYSQTFINGNFEINTYNNGCNYNNTDVNFNSNFTNVYAFGKAYAPSLGGFVGEIDVQTNNCYVNPQNGYWCIGLTSGLESVNDADAVAIELTSNLIIGQSYQLSFYVYGNTAFNNTISNIKIGLSNSNSAFGNLIYTAVPNANIWKNIVFNFIATQSSKYITVSGIPGNQSWNQIDNFTLNNTLSVVDYEMKKSNIYPNPFSISTNIKIKENLENAILTIYSTTGQQIKQINNINGNNILLNRDNLPKGIYFVELKQKNQLITINKILITD
jgi:hypothetical protein